MSGIKTRVEKMESVLGGKSDLHYVLVFGIKDESMQKSIDRALEQRCITMEQVGFISYMGPGSWQDIDKHNYRSRDDLIGYREARARWKQILANIPPSIGPPSERCKQVK